MSQSSAQRGQGRGDWFARLKDKTDKAEVTRINDQIFLVESFANTFMVVTGDGNVVIDTSRSANAPKNKEILQEVNSDPVKYIVLTHAHFDHRGGVGTWKEEGTEVIAQEGHVEFIHYMDMLSGFFSHRSGAQYGFKASKSKTTEGNSGETDATIMFEDTYEFELGGLGFELFHTPGETYDALSVWIPEHKAVFVGDIFYKSFPNLYTLRGTRPRWAMDYVNSLDRVLSLEPEIFLPAHGGPIFGFDTIREEVERFMTAILYVHDKTVEGMNAGKDVHTLMAEVTLPPGLDVGEAYGAVAWSVRGIYEGYVGWFDGNTSSMYEVPMRNVYPDLVELAGGAENIAQRAKEYALDGDLKEALHLTDVALEAEPYNQLALGTRSMALYRLLKQCNNSNEAGWLRADLMKAQALLKGD